jgi:hypothetical protein
VDVLGLGDVGRRHCGAIWYVRRAALCLAVDLLGRADCRCDHNRSFPKVFWRIILAGRPDWQQDVAVSMCLAVVIAPCVVALNRLLVSPDALRAMGLLSVICSVISTSFCMIAIIPVARISDSFFWF